MDSDDTFDLDDLIFCGLYPQSPLYYSDTFQGSEFATEEEKELLESCHYDKENCGASKKEQYLEFFGNYADVKRSSDGSSGDVVYYDVLDLSEMSLKLLEAVEVRKKKLSERSCVRGDMESKSGMSGVYGAAEPDTDSSSDPKRSPQLWGESFETAADVESVVGGEQKMMELKEDIKSVRASVMSWMRESLQATFPDHLPRLPEEVLNIILGFTNVSNPVKFPFFDRRKDHWKFVKYEGIAKHLLCDLYSQMTGLYLIIKDILFDYSGYPSDLGRTAARFGEIWGTVKMRVEDLKAERVVSSDPRAEEECWCAECGRANLTQSSIKRREEDLS